MRIVRVSSLALTCLVRLGERLACLLQSSCQLIDQALLFREPGFDSFQLSFELLDSPAELVDPMLLPMAEYLFLIGNVIEQILHELYGGLRPLVIDVIKLLACKHPDQRFI
jgi:hypothetical protein